MAHCEVGSSSMLRFLLFVSCSLSVLVSAALVRIFLDNQSNQPLEENVYFMDYPKPTEEHSELSIGTTRKPTDLQFQRSAVTTILSIGCLTQTRS